MTLLRVLPHTELCPQGATIDAEPGTSICDALLDVGINIDHACEKACACTTWARPISPPSRATNELSDMFCDLNGATRTPS